MPVVPKEHVLTSLQRHHSGRIIILASIKLVRAAGRGDDGLRSNTSQNYAVFRGWTDKDKEAELSVLREREAPLQLGRRHRQGARDRGRCGRCLAQRRKCKSYNPDYAAKGKGRTIEEEEGIAVVLGLSRLSI